MASPTAQEFVAALRRVEEEGEVDAMAQLYAEEARLLNPTERTAHGDTHNGPEGARRFWEAYRKSFESIRSRFHAVLESDTRIMLEWTSECRTAAGVETSYDGVSVVETKDGRIVRFSAYFDPTQLTAHPALDTEMRASGRPQMADRAPQDEGTRDAETPDDARARAEETGAQATS
jgi:ketosteroid isomerase-like protein